MPRDPNGAAALDDAAAASGEKCARGRQPGLWIEPGTQQQLSPQPGKQRAVRGKTYQAAITGARGGTFPFRPPLSQAHGPQLLYLWQCWCGTARLSRLGRRSNDVAGCCTGGARDRHSAAATLWHGGERPSARGRRHNVGGGLLRSCTTPHCCHLNFCFHASAMFARGAAIHLPALRGAAHRCPEA